MALALDDSPKVNKFKLQFCYYVHFQTNTLEKGMYPDPSFMS